VLKDLQVLHSLEARLILGAAVIDDVIGLVILGVSRRSPPDGVQPAGRLRILGWRWSSLRRPVDRTEASPAAVRPGRSDAGTRRAGRIGVRVPAAALCLAERAGTALIIGAFAAGLILSETNQFRLDQGAYQAGRGHLHADLLPLSIGAFLDPRVWNPFVPKAIRRWRSAARSSPSPSSESL